MIYQNTEFANQLVGFCLYGSNKLLDQTLTVSKKAFEQTQDYVQSLKDASSVEDFIKSGEKAGKEGSKLAEDYLRNTCAVVGETASQFALRQGEAVAEAFAKAPGGAYGDMFRQAARNQLDAYKAVVDSYNKSIKPSGNGKASRSK
ncbi:MAG: phasin family protein [Betaproteobacteria bacterium]|nr:phasin family protein [Betaproteobacteria bacterium]